MGSSVPEPFTDPLSAVLPDGGERARHRLRLAGALLFGAGLALLLLNVLFRFGATGDRERDEEEAARDYLSEHGHWPDEKKPRSGS